MSRVVVYHAACLDGFTAAWAVWKKFGDTDTTYFPAGYHQEPIADVAGKDLVFVDFSYDRATIERMAKEAASIVVLDHHQTHEQALAGLPYATFDMNRSGAGIAWDFFHSRETRPWIVDYVEDRDLWRFQLPRSKPVNAWLGAQTRDSFDQWERISKMSVSESAVLGTAVEMSVTRYVQEMSQHARRITWHGHDVSIVNAPYINTSELVGHLAQNATFAVGWFQRADGQYQYSLRSRSEFDVSEIAKLYGGGGHKNAAGFTIPHRIPEDT